MAETIYAVQNCSVSTMNVASPGALPVSQPTGTAVRTMMQLQASSSRGFSIVEWGISFDGSAAATPIKVDLMGTTVAATMSTAYIAGDFTTLSLPGGEASLMAVGATTNSGYATAAVTEGTVANYRLFDMQLIAPTGQYVKQFPLGREPRVAVSNFCRIRVLAGTGVNCFCYVVWSE